MVCLIDTNVILDYTLQREPFRQAAVDCVERLVFRKTAAYITASSMTDIYYTTRKHLKDKAAAKETVAGLLKVFLTAPVDRTDLLNALTVGIEDYEDALIAVCAKRIKADYIITRNVKDFQSSPVNPLTPEEFLSTDS
ncbi:MAG: PIN domain-containing protein [Oscillospiraceae bacterium]|nr:PIN domain-containing protein [Oscillospiraceae bacterium]